MTTTADRFALIGRSFPSDVYEGLYQASLSARAAKRAQPTPPRAARIWRGSGEPVTLPLRLPV